MDVQDNRKSKIELDVRAIQMRSRIATWKQVNPDKPIPEYAWKTLDILTQDYSLLSISRFCGVAYGRLRQRASQGRGKSMARIAAKNEWLEVRPDAIERQPQWGGHGRGPLYLECMGSSGVRVQVRYESGSQALLKEVVEVLR